MGVLQGVGDVGDQPGGFVERQAPAGQDVGERQAFDEIAHEVGYAVVDADFVDGDDRREAQLGDGAGFAQETIDILRAGADVAGAGNFDGDDAIELGIVGFEYGAERAVSNGAENFELADSLLGRSVPGDGGEARELKAGAAAGTGDFAAGRDVGDLDGILAMRATQVDDGP